MNFLDNGERPITRLGQTYWADLAGAACLLALWQRSGWTIDRVIAAAMFAAGATRGLLVRRDDRRSAR